MSIGRAMGALGGRTDAVVYGVAWAPQTESPTVTAQMTGADFAFVADGPEAAAAVGALHEADVAAFVAVMGPVGLVAGTIGWTETVKLSVQNPAALGEALEVAAGATVGRLHWALSIGADAVILADDLASADGWLLDPRFVEDVVMPVEHSCGRVIEGVPVLFHSDGDIRALYPALAAGCFSGVHIAAGDSDVTRAAVAAAVAAGLVAIGGIPAVTLSAENAPVIAARISALQPLGLLMVSDDGGMVDQAQVSALAQVYELLKEKE